MFIVCDINHLVLKYKKLSKYIPQYTINLKLKMVEALTIMSGQILTALYNMYLSTKQNPTKINTLSIFSILLNTVFKKKNIPVPQIIKLDLI